MARPPTAQPFLSYTVLLCMTIRATWWALAGAVLTLAVMAPPASAAFAGANGKIAVTPLSGAGLVIASPQTGRAQRVCDAPQNCGLRLTDPRFSANGREVVFRDAAGQLEVTTPSGTCVFCLSSHPLWNLDGTSPAFAPNGNTITYVHHGLWQVGPGSSSPRRLLNGPVTSAVWSQSHQLLVTRRGWVWTGRPTLAGVLSLRRVVRGGAPAASPTGGELAYTRDGSVFTLRLAGHKITRLARGSAPTFSPDGRSLAYLNQHHQVTISPLGHGRARTLARLRGRSLDWQPITTATRKGCEAANGVVVAANSAATIRAAADTQQFHIGWNGCLTALGIPFHLNGGFDGDGYDLSLERVALAGNYAALDFVFTDKYTDYSDTINVYDLRAGTLVHSTTVPCEAGPCDVTALTVNADGFAAWHSVQTPVPAGGSITAISCPTPEFCVAGGLEGELFVTTAPSGGRSAWTRISLGSGAIAIRGISCPNAAVCVAVTDSGSVYSSADPTGGAATWHEASLGASTLQDVSCPSVSLCVAVGGSETYITSDPTGPANGWSAHPVSSASVGLNAVSCPTDSLCVVGGGGDVFTSSDPADPTPSWTATQLPGLNSIRTVDCPTATFCAAGAEPNSGGAIVTSTNPVGGGESWTVKTVNDPITAVTCAGTSLCLVVDTVGVLTSVDPSEASPSWTQTTLPNTFTGASCPSANLCAVASGPSVLTTAYPTGASSSWASTPVDALGCYPCLAETLAAVDDHGAQTLDTAPAGSGTVIANLRFSGDTLTWTDGGSPHSASLS
jgi:WD40-like Beta Propeller Repeat